MIYAYKNIAEGKSKYIKETREKDIFYGCSILYIFALYVLPPYFGIPFPLFDLTALRIMMLVLFAFIFADHVRSRDFLDMIKCEKITGIILCFTFVIGYTMVLRADFNAFFNPFMEFMQLYLLLYVIRDRVGVKTTIKLVIVFIYLLVILGFVEAATKVSPFVYLNTINKVSLYSGAFIRNGNYRIMSNGGHSLGYGLLLMTAIPFAGIDLEKNEFNIFKRPILLAGIIGNIFLTGSRSSLGVLMVELVLMFFLTEKKYIKMNIIFLFLFLISFTAVVLATKSTPFGRYVMLQITSLIDTVFGTTTSIKYGADSNLLSGSSEYRNHLWKIFGISWLNPILGLGKKRVFSTVIDGAVINSIDNFYVVQYISYAYPGFISYTFFLLYMLIRMIKELFRSGSAIVKMVLIATIGYYIHLSIADALMTLKYLYVLFAIFLCLDLSDDKMTITSKYFGKRKSAYVK